MKQINPSPNSMLANYGITDQDWVTESLSDLGESKDAAHVNFISRQISLAEKNGFDFGCGHGRTVNALRNLGADMWGCDISPSILKSEDPKLSIGGIEILRETKANLDFILSISVLQLIKPKERQEFYKICASKLKPGGSLFIVNGNPHTNIPRKAINLPDPDNYSIPGFTRNTLEFTKMPASRPVRLLRRLIKLPPKFHFNSESIEKTSPEWRRNNCQILMFHFRRV